MKSTRFIVFGALMTLIIGAPAVFAAPCESVESACASTAYQKVDALLGERIVADRLQAIGVSQVQARARVSRLNVQQLQQLASQADMIQAGGTIQRGDLHPLGPLNHMWDQFCMFWLNVYHFIFTWDSSAQPR
jgi:hypothetical protein